MDAVFSLGATIVCSFTAVRLRTDRPAVACICDVRLHLSDRSFNFELKNRRQPSRQ